MGQTVLLRSFFHEQSTPSDTWTVTHNLNVSSPCIDVWVTVDSVVRKIIPNGVRVINTNTVEITFTMAAAGHALFV